MNKYAVLDKNTKEVITLIVWDGITPYNPGDMYDVVPMTEQHRIVYDEKIRLHNEAILKQKAEELRNILEQE